MGYILIYLAIGVAVVTIVREQFRQRSPDGDIDMRPGIHGLLLVLWPVLGTIHLAEVLYERLERRYGYYAEGIPHLVAIYGILIAAYIIWAVNTF